MDPISCSSLLDLVDAHSVIHPERIAYQFLTSGDVTGPIDRLTYGELERRARSIGALLRHADAVGERVLLLYPAGLSFVTGFLGCAFGGAIAVPAYPPDLARLDRTLPRLEKIAADCGARFVLTTQAILDQAEAIVVSAPALRALSWLATDAVPDIRVGDGSRAEPSAETLAFLQYTSGSTGAPKGVMVSHGNLVHNLRCLHDTFEQDAGSQLVSWLPAYHDMGLIAGLLYPLFIGAPATLMSPLAFLQRPQRWLEAISHVGGTFSVAPNFGYDLCARKVSDDERDRLDLSTWRVAGNGAEPVRMSTLDRFCDRFERRGFRRQAFLPCYGLAEGTLIVSGAGADELPRMRTERATDGEARVRVSSGRPRQDLVVAIVDPVTGRRCADAETGEIWTRSASNGLGYWNRPAESKATFGAHTDDGDGPFLRTGDLGAVVDGELYVSGRLKDLIIVDGLNHYPQDIELTVQDCHAAVRGGCVAAFALDGDDDGERLVIVAEIDDATGADAVIGAIRAAVAGHHDLEVHAVALLPARTIAKTSSGKIQRRASRERFVAGTLGAIASWARSGSASASARRSERTPMRTRDEIGGWLIAQLALRLGLDPSGIDTDTPFASYGLASRDAVGLSGELERWLGTPVPPTALYQHPTVALLAVALAAAPSTALATSPSTALAASPSTNAPASADAPPIAGGDRPEAIAVIGIGCRFPGARGAAEYWSLLAGGVDAVAEVPLERWDIDAYHQAGTPTPGRMYTRRGGFIDGVADFEPQFFGLSVAEASHMDPQQRILLELAWEALEDAGVPPEQVAGTATGVFVGITTSDYGQLQRARGHAGGPYEAYGNLFCMAANRLSYALDLRGPSFAVDTACSSSMVAIHQACESLRRGEATLALAGGVNLMLSPDTTVSLCQFGALSPDDRCHTFAAAANGYVRGEGGGLIVLKPLAQAVADGDRVYAVIRGSAINQDGRSNGITAPSQDAQTRVLRDACVRAGVDPARVQYVETHGTGTALGDPIEAGALGTALGTAAGREQPCAIGSAKTNLGHLEAAAGVAGLAKVALALHHGAIPPSLHFDTPNPLIQFDQLGVRVQTELTPWPAGPRIAGASGFGGGGTNAHVVLEQAPSLPAPARRDDGRRHVLAISARSPEALTALGRRYLDALASVAAPLAAITYTAAVRRGHHPHRAAVVASSVDELRERLAQLVDGEPVRGAVRGRAPDGKRARPRLVFVCTGQGPQYVGMAQRLLATAPAFRAAFDDCERAMQPHLGWSLRDQLFADEATSQLGRDEVVQPLLFAIQVGLAAQWRAWGVVPDAVVGHSMGEVAAAHIAGALELDEAARVICRRAELLASLHGQGGMAVVGLSRADALAELRRFDGRLHLASSNGPALSVVSGERDALAALVAELERRDVFCRAIKATAAGHSPVVDPVARALADELAWLRPRATAVPFYSTVDAAPLAGTALDAGYWARNVRQPVLFHPTIERLLADGHGLFLELSANPTLVVPIEDAIVRQGLGARALGSLARKRLDDEAMLEAFGALYTLGYPVDFARLYTQRHPVVSLPSGPWHRQRCWFEVEAEAEASAPVPSARAAVPVAVPAAVAAAFAGALSTGAVGADDNFFELGGTSLTAAQMLYGLRASLARDIPLRLLFEHPTIASFTRALEALATTRTATAATAATAAITRVDADDYPLSFNQERMLQGELASNQAPVHFVAQHLMLRGRLDVDALARALARLADVHAALRTRLVRLGAQPRQVLAPSPAVELQVLALAPGDDLEGHLRGLERPFELFDAPLCRFALTRIGDDHHALSIVVHHLITDGWSQGVLFQDLVAAYGAYARGAGDELAPALRFVDYAHWEQRRFHGEHLERARDGWRRRLADLPRMRVPFVRSWDQHRGPVAPARVIEVEVDAASVAALERFAQASAATLQMAISTGLLLLLRRHAGDDRVALPTSGSNRERPEVVRTFGYLTQPRLISVDFAAARTVGEALRRVRDAVLAAADEQELSVSHHFHLEGCPPELAPFDINLNYLPHVALPTALGEATIALQPRRTPFAAGRPLTVIARELGPVVRLSFAYAAELVDRDALGAFADELRALLAAMATAGDTALDQVAPLLEVADHAA